VQIEQEYITSLTY